ncbi:MAG: glycosyltransferase family 2 protein [Parcubacteria group bacterium]|nr:glycosyltransferase family 2 protein [Parcubacteria group bacterium]
MIQRLGDIGRATIKRHKSGFVVPVADLVPALPELSLVIPVKDEEESLPILHERIRRSCTEVTENYEVIFVNDGSTDNTQHVIEDIHAKDPRVRGIELRKNFGQTAAMAAGFDHARGEIIITMDADLQNDPADIPRLLEKMGEGYDIVSGWRKDRKDKFITRRIPSQVANALISRLTKVRLHDYGCSLKAYRKDALAGVRLYGEMHRFIPIFSSIKGAKIAEIEVNHFSRKFGTSKYGLSRVFKVILDLIIVHFFLRFLTNPIRFFGVFGILFMLAGSGISAYLTFLKFAYGARIGDRPLLLLGVLFILVGIQITALGILGELLSRIYFESQNKQTYAIRKIVG